MGKILKNVKLCELKHAGWNPRSADDLKADNPEMAKLVSSVKALGVVQPIAVWTDDGMNLVIAGNRRFEAAVICGLKEIPAMCFSGITEVQAREITRVENEVRLGIDPIRDAVLIEDMMKLGYEQKEIATHFGVSEATICRRVKLLGLIPEIREAAMRGGVSADALERIALHTPEIQKKCAKNVIEAIGKASEGGEEARWSQFSWDFGNKTKELAGVKWDTSVCVNCPKRTGAQPDLWGDMKKGDVLGRCLDCKCFADQEKKRVIKMVRDKVGDDVEINSIEDSGFGMWEVENEKMLFSKRRTVNFCAAYYQYSHWNDEIKVVYGVSISVLEEVLKKREEQEKEQRKADAAMEKKEEELRKEFSRQVNLVKEGRRPFGDAANTAIIDMCGGVYSFLQDKESLVAKHVFVKSPLSEILAKALICGCDSWDFKEGNFGWQLRLVEEFPALAKALKVKSASIKKARAAIDALDKYNLENPEPKWEDFNKDGDDE